MKKILVKDIRLPLLALLALNFANFIRPAPVILQMIVSAVALAYVGCILSASIQSATYEEIQNCEKKLRKGSEESGFLKRCWEIGVYPLTATVVLLLLYFFVTKIEQITMELALNAIFMVLSTLYCLKTCYPQVCGWIRERL
jgi:hypothetical protein